MVLVRLALRVDDDGDELTAALAGDHSVRCSGVVVDGVALADDLDMVVDLDFEFALQDVVELLTLVGAELDRISRARRGRTSR